MSKEEIIEKLKIIFNNKNYGLIQTIMALTFR